MRDPVFAVGNSVQQEKKAKNKVNWNVVWWRFRKHDYVFEYKKRYIDECDGYCVLLFMWLSFGIHQVSTLLKAKCPQNGMYSVAVKTFNKDTDEGKSYWQAWRENKSLSSEKKLFQSSQCQFLFAAPTRAAAVWLEPFWSDLACEVKKIMQLLV